VERGEAGGGERDVEMLALDTEEGQVDTGTEGREGDGEGGVDDKGGVEDVEEEGDGDGREEGGEGTGCVGGADEGGGVANPKRVRKDRPTAQVPHARLVDKVL